MSAEVSDWAAWFHAEFSNCVHPSGNVEPQCMAWARQVERTSPLAARVASAAAERDQAVAMADSMQHFADVAEVCERKSNEYAAENAELRSRIEALASKWAASETIWPSVPAQLRAVLAPAHDEGQSHITFHVGDNWPTPNHCRRTADALDTLTPARYGDILRAYADAEDARFEQHGPIRAHDAPAEPSGVEGSEQR